MFFNAPFKSWLGLIVLVVHAQTAQAVDYVVTATNVFGTGNLGLILQQANAAPGPHTITFDPSILPAVITTGGTLAIQCDVTITGPGADQVTLDFEGFQRGFTIQAGRTVSLSGMKIMNTRAWGLGGSFGNFSTNPTAGSPGEGGGIHNAGTLTVTQCVFENCQAVGGPGGGGAFFTNQFGQPGGAGHGGAIFSNGPSLTVVACTFFQNRAEGGDGGNGASNTQQGEFSFGGSGGAAGAARGGAIYVAAGTCSIVRSTFSGQSATGGTGGSGGQAANGAYNLGGTGGNAEGGAIHAEVPLTLTNCTVANGFSRSGNGGFSGQSTPRVPGSARAGGVNAVGTVTLGNSLIGSNEVGVAFDPRTAADVFGSFSSLGYNLIGALPAGVTGLAGASELTGTTASPLNPKVQSVPAPNGAAVATLRLLPGSPALDKGKALAGATVDQRGLARTVNLPDVDFPNAAGGDGTDIGAFESQVLPNSQPVINGGVSFNLSAGQSFNGYSLFAADDDGDPLTFSIVGTPLPTGLTLNGDGTFSGSTTVTGSGNYRAKVNDGKEDSEVVSFTLQVNEVPSLVVSTVQDVVSVLDGVTSLREAVALAQNDAQPTPVTFDPTVFAERQVLVPTFNAMAVTESITIIGPTAGVTIAPLLATPLFTVSNGTMTVERINFGGQSTALFEVSGSAHLILSRCTIGKGTCWGTAPLTNDGGMITLQYCTIAGMELLNGTASTSAIWQNFGSLVMVHCTVAGNLGPNAIEIVGGAFTMGNCLVAGNLTSTGTAANQIKGAVTSLGYNLIGSAPDMTLTGTTTGNQLNVADPLLDPEGLNWNGGPTRTIALMAGSPAIDKGQLLGEVAADQRGRVRPIDNRAVRNAVGGDGSDIGAFEVDVPEPLISVRQVPSGGPPGASLDSGAVIDVGQSVEVGYETLFTFSLRNRGTAPLQLNGTPKVSLTGAGASSFVLEQPAETTLAPGATTTFSVLFWPQSPGTKTAQLTIASNDAAQPSFVIALSGAAVDNTALAPTLLAPRTNGGVYPQASVTFKLPEPAKAGSVLLRFQLMELPFTAYEFSFPDVVASGLHTRELDTVARGMGPGPYFVSLEYLDVNDFDSGTMVQGVLIRPVSVLSTLQRASLSAAPDAGLLLPAGAVLTTFNLPAIDDAGNLAYLAKWAATTPKASGTGLFLNGKCAGFIGQGSAIPGGSKYTAFTDPVIDGGQLVCIASLAGGTPKPPAKAVVTTFSTQAQPGLSVVTALGRVAPDQDGNDLVGAPSFSAFRAVDVRGGTIAIFAQVAGGFGVFKASAANDVGLWIKSNVQPLRQVLREGQMIGSRKVATLSSFSVGALSGGQGRGWLTKPVGTLGAVLALVTFTDKTQAIVSAEAGVPPTLFSTAGALGTAGGPDLTGASFTSYGFPAANDSDTSTFLASLKTGVAGVTASNARGVFLSHPNGSYTTLARVGLPSGVLGSTFSLLRDPVLSEDNGVAFLATLKGGTARGLATTTLWWKPGGEPLRVLAQGGAEAPDVPGSQWKAFTNLGVTGLGRGPVFAASLVVGPGGVTSSTDTGVWSTDFTGRPRLLFREGDTVNGKRLTAFNLLRSTTGNLGITRSLNDRLQVTWIATFSDRTTALMTTEIP